MAKYYDLHVHSNFSIGENSVAELSKFAQDLGYVGIAICDHYAGKEKFLQQKQAIAEAQKQIGIEILQGIEIQPKNPKQLNALASLLREHVVVLIAHGGDYSINRAACQNSRIDILAHPELGRLDSGLDEVCLNAARDNNVAVQINFREILYGYRKPRTYILSHIAENIRLCNAVGVKMVVCSGAQTVWDMRDPRSLAAIVNILGLELGKSIDAVSSIPEAIAETNKAKLSGKIHVSGVEVVG